MALTSNGYVGGPLSDDDFGAISSAGAWVEGDAFGVSQPTAGTRSVRINTGKAIAHGVRVTNDAVIDQALSAPSSGGQWYLIALRRNWASSPKVSTVVALAGPSTGTTTVPLLVPSALPGTIAYTPGTGTADQPLAWVFVNSANTTCTIFDVRLFGNQTRNVMAPNLAALITAHLVGLLRDGAIVPVQTYATTYGGFHERSVWVRRNGVLLALGRIVEGGDAGFRLELQGYRDLNIGLALQNGETIVFDSYTANEYRLNAAGNAWNLTQSGDNAVLSGTPQVSAALTSTYQGTNNDQSVATTAWVQQFGSGAIRLNDLSALAALMGQSNRPPVGTLALLGASTWGGVNIAPSMWRMGSFSDGRAYPVGPLFLDNLTSLGNLEYQFQNNSAFYNFLIMRHMDSIAVVPSAYAGDNAKNIEYRWDTVGYLGRSGFKMWPGPFTLFRLEARVNSDQQLNANGYTNLVYDTWDTNPINAQYGGSGGYSVVMPSRTEGRWRFQWSFAVTNDDQGERYLMTCYNQTTGSDETNGAAYLYNYRGVNGIGEHLLTQQNSLNTAIQRGGTGGQWRARWNAQYFKPRWSMQLIGWT